MNTKQKIGRACMIVGILLILGALALLGYNQWDANRADKASQDALGKLEETLTETIEDKTKDEEPVVQPELDPEQEMTVTDIDGWGYIGSTVPFIFCIALIFGGPSLFDWSTVACTRASFIITAIWWVAFTIPLLTSYRQVHYRATRDQLGSAVRGTFSELAGTFGKIVKNKPLWMFMIAFFFYIDAVNTVISMSTSYGAELGIDSTQLVVALLVTQFVAFPCAILYGRLAGRFGCKVMITAAVVAYMCIVFFAAFFLKSAVEFWILAILVGMFQGGIQALSRSYYGKIIPKDHANEYYGFYDIFGKTASIIGTFLVATTTSLTGNASLGVLSIAVLLVAALVFLLLQKDPTRE